MKGRALIIHGRRSRATRLWAGLAALTVASATIGISAPAASASGSNTLTIKAGEYTYQLKGSPKPGCAQINFKNTGRRVPHDGAMVQLKKGTTPAAAEDRASLSNDQKAFDGDRRSGRRTTVSRACPTLLGPSSRPRP